MDKATQNLILETTCSKSLLKAIHKTSFKLSDIDLLILAYKHAPSFDTRLELLRIIESKTKEASVKEQAVRCITYEESQFEQLIRLEDNCIYEVKIKDKPSSYEESYLSETYDGALRKVEHFCKYYDVELSTASRFSISKRRVMDDPSEEAFDEDKLGEATFTAGPTLLNMWHEDFPSELLDDESKVERDNDGYITNSFFGKAPKLPRFLNNMDIVKYDDWGKTQYAVIFIFDYAEEIDYEDDCAYCVMLDTDMISSKSPSTQKEFNQQMLFGRHTHIAYPRLEIIKANDLPHNLKASYLLFKRLYKKFNK